MKQSRTLTVGNGRNIAGVSLKGRFLLMDNGETHEISELLDGLTGAITDEPSKAAGFVYVHPTSGYKTETVQRCRSYGVLLDETTHH